MLYLDTSALAKWYLPENFSAEVDALISKQGGCITARLSLLELRCLLSRKRRNKDISKSEEERVYQKFLEQIALGYFGIVPVSDDFYSGAVGLLERVQPLALRTLDALHLQTALSADAKQFATADKTQAHAAAKLGMKVHQFFA